MQIFAFRIPKNLGHVTIPGCLASQIPRKKNSSCIAAWQECTKCIRAFLWTNCSKSKSSNSGTPNMGGEVNGDLSVFDTRRNICAKCHVLWPKPQQNKAKTKHCLFNMLGIPEQLRLQTFLNNNSTTNQKAACSKSVKSRSVTGRCSIVWRKQDLWAQRFCDKLFLHPFS